MSTAAPSRLLRYDRRVAALQQRAAARRLYLSMVDAGLNQAADVMMRAAAKGKMPTLPELFGAMPPEVQIDLRSEMSRKLDRADAAKKA